MERRVSVDQTSQAYVPAFVDRIVRPLTRVLNPLIMRFAGGWWFPMFSVLHHRGHRSGRMYATPDTNGPVVKSLEIGTMLYPTGQKRDPLWEVTDELGAKGWVSSLLFQLAR